MTGFSFAYINLFYVIFIISKYKIVVVHKNNYKETNNVFLL